MKTNEDLLTIAEEILDVEWETTDKENELIYYFKNSNEYGDAYNQVIKNENLEPIEEEDSISLFATSFNWNYFDGDDEVCTVKMTSDYEAEEYLIKVWTD